MMAWYVAFRTRGGDHLFGRRPFQTLGEAYDAAGDICTGMEKADMPTWGLEFVEQDEQGREVRKLFGWSEADQALGTTKV